MLAAATLISLLLAPTPTGPKFVGFAKTAPLAAWKQNVAEPAGEGREDRCTLILVAHTKTGDVVGAFLGSNVRRFDSKGRQIKASQGALLKAHETFAQAGSQAQWRKLSKTVKGWRSKRLDMSVEAIRLQPDPDSAVRGKAEKDVISVRSRSPGTALGYTAVARTHRGTLLNVARFRHEAKNNAQLDARVHAFYSPTGYQVAVFNTFIVGGEPQQTTLRVMHMGAYPLATNLIGAINLAQTNLRMVEQEFKSLHPGGTGLYDKFVTRY